MTDKKTPKPVLKDLKGSTSKKQSKKTPRAVKSANSSEDVPSFSGFSVPSVEPPDGFMVVSITKALMEYSGPLMETVPDRTDMEKANEIFSVAAAIWDYAGDDKSIQMNKKSKTEILALMQYRLELDLDQANDFFSMMVERKHFLFPAEIQPLERTIMFMRKSAGYRINEFEYESLDQEFIQKWF